MPTSTKTTKQVAKRSSSAPSKATKARVQKRLNRDERFVPQRFTQRTSAERLAQLDKKYTTRDMWVTAGFVGLLVLNVCMFAWR